MRRISTILIAMLIFALSLTALAEDSPAYIAPGDCGEPVRLIQSILGISETDPATGEAYYGEDTYAMITSYQTMYELPYADGVLDDATLALLLDLDPTDVANSSLVWIPMHGGTRHHAKGGCSGMIDPRQIPVICAEALGYTYCRRCQVSGY